MRKLVAVATMLTAGTVASATDLLTLQLDINQVAMQTKDAGGNNSAFAGLNHTGSLNFDLSPGITHLLGVFIQAGASAPVNAGFNGQLTGFDGVLNLNNGQVAGGHIVITVDNTDSYTAQIQSGAGFVSTFAGGGYRVQGLTVDGSFTGSMFGNVDIGPWYHMQGITGGLEGSFLSFNFNPDTTGAAHGDIDVFVQVIPLPPAVWTGMAMLGLVWLGAVKRRR
jgi:hypothetical protein